MAKGFGDRIRALFARFGYTCDGCGGEVFDYPNRRLCADCEAAMERNDGKTCEKCGRKTRSEGVCLACKGNLPHFGKALSPFVYEGVAASLVNRLKNGDRYLANLFSEELAAKISKTEQVEGALVTCVPLTEEKLRFRGYNQADELAKLVAEKLGLEYDEEILIKTKETPPQKNTTGEERRENVSGAYRVVKRKTVRGKTIYLIDDIMTTGATGSECARVLKNAGAKEVVFLTVCSLKERS